MTVEQTEAVGEETCLQSKSDKTHQLKVASFFATYLFEKEILSGVWKNPH